MLCKIGSVNTCLFYQLHDRSISLSMICMSSISSLHKLLYLFAWISFRLYLYKSSMRYLSLSSIYFYFYVWMYERASFWNEWPVTNQVLHLAEVWRLTDGVVTILIYYSQIGYYHPIQTKIEPLQFFYFNCLKLMIFFLFFRNMSSLQPFIIRNMSKAHIIENYEWAILLLSTSNRQVIS